MTDNVKLSTIFSSRTTNALSTLKFILLFSLYNLYLFGSFAYSATTLPEPIELSSKNDSSSPFPKILILNSYNIDFPWTENIIRGIREAFSNRLQQAQLSFEFMDARNFSSDLLEYNLKELVKKKYFEQINAVIVTDNDALNFAIKYRNTLFENIPIFFCGINNLDFMALKEINGISGFIESVNVGQTLDLIERLHPNISRLTVLGDSSKAGSGILLETELTLNERSKSYETASIYKWSFNELANHVRNAPKDNVFLALSVFQDKFGNTYSPSEIIKLLKSNTDAPIYTLWENYVSQGLLGGWVISGFNQGQAIANMVIDHLKNPSKQNNLILNGPTVPIFNYQMMEKQHISEIQLPAQTKFLFKPPTFYAKYQLLIWFGIIFILTQTGIIIFLAINIRIRKLYQERLTIFKQALKHIPVGVIVANRDFVVEFVNRQYCQDSRTSQAKLVKKNLFTLNYFPFSQSEDLAAFEQLQPDSVWQVEASFPKSQPQLTKGKTATSSKEKEIANKSFRFMISPIYLKNGDIGYYLILRENISQQKRSEALLVQQANYDQLTSLPNRNHLLGRIQQAVLKAQKKHLILSVLFIDLDGFKQVNDNYGHLVGDKVLRLVSERLTECIRKNDVLARIGGDEFVILLEGQESTNVAQRISEKIIQRLSQPFVTKGSTLYLSASIGIATYPNDGDSAITLLKNADIAMYAAKTQKRGAFQFFHIDLNRKAKRKLKIQTLLRNAIRNNELKVCYQPLVNTSLDLYGCEALLRWQSEELGPISPTEFIPIAEDIGEIVRIGDWILQSALSQLSLWQSQGLDHMQMSINVSYRQLEDKNFLAKLRNSIRAHRVTTTQITLEITEELFIQDTSNTLDTLLQIKKMGIKLALDDFGTGYSSLSYLTLYPFDQLKIDRSFMKSIGRQAKVMKLLRGIGSMSKQLGLEVVLEGVESAYHRRKIEHLDIDYYQGYWIDKPLTADTFFNKWLDIHVDDEEDKDIAKAHSDQKDIICS